MSTTPAIASHNDACSPSPLRVRRIRPNPTASRNLDPVSSEARREAAGAMVAPRSRVPGKRVESRGIAGRPRGGLWGLRLVVVPRQWDSALGRSSARARCGRAPIRAAQLLPSPRLASLLLTCGRRFGISRWRMPWRASSSRSERLRRRRTRCPGAALALDAVRGVEGEAPSTNVTSRLARLRELVWASRGRTSTSACTKS